MCLNYQLLYIVYYICKIIKIQSEKNTLFIQFIGEIKKHESKECNRDKNSAIDKGPELLCGNRNGPP